MPDDASLVNRARAGDAHAFALLLRRHEGAVAGTLRAAVGDPETVADLRQEAALLAWLQLDRLRDATRFGPWLVGIARNLAKRHHRSPTALSTRVVYDEARTDPLVAHARDSAEQVLFQATVRELLSAIAALPAGQRDAVVLHHLAGLSQGEVAARLGTGVGAVRTRLHKARRTLRRRLLPSHPQATEAHMTDTIPARIADVRRTPAGRHVVILETAEHAVPIWVGASEAHALVAGLAEVEQPRPETHALALSLLRASGRTLAAVRVTALDAAIFYAEIELDDGTVVDARPSDALVLALDAGAAIQVSSSVLRSTRAGAPEPYASDLTAATHGAATLASELRAEIEDRAAELATLRPPD